MQNVRGERSLTEQVQQEPPGVDDIFSRARCQGVIENDESIPVEASRVADSTSTIQYQPLDVCRWKHFGARPKDRAPVEGVPMECSQAEQVRQEPPPVYDVLARGQSQSGTEDDVSTLQGAAASRVADSASTILHQPPDVRRWEHFGARPKDSTPVEGVPMECSQAEQVRQELPPVYDVLARDRCQGGAEDEESTLQGAAASRVVDSAGPILHPPLDVCRWECFVARPKDRSLVEGVPKQCSQAEQVRQEPPPVYDVSARHQFQGGTEDDDSTLQEAAASRVADSASTILYQPLNVRRWEQFGDRPRNRVPVQRVPLRWSPSEQVREEPPPVYDVSARHRCRGETEDDESTLQEAAASREADSAGTILHQPLDVRRWEQFGDRPRNRDPVQRVPLRWSPSEQVREEPPPVYDVSARHQFQGGTEDDESTLQEAAASRVADSTSTILHQPLDVHSTSNGNTEQLDTMTGSCPEDEECLSVPLPSANLPASVDDCICESLGSTNNSRLAVREGIAQPRVVQGISRVQAQIQRQREEQERR